MGAPQDAAAFARFEHERWEASVEAFDRHFGPLTRSVEAALLAALPLRSGADALDVATGPGYIALSLAAQGCRVVAVDFSAAMIERARLLGHETAVDFRVGDAEALEFADATFDFVTMNFGMLHLARPEQAAREAWRVLRPGGWYAWSVWTPPEESRGFAIALEALAQHGDATVALPAGPPFFRYSQPDAGLDLLKESGFGEATAQRVELCWRLPDPAALFEAFHDGTARTGGALRAQPPERLVRVRTAMLQAADGYRHGEELQIPMSALVYRARRPA
ncbi:MAG: methyltransferase domain-containing protein [Verrucomicrobia bacterium]|nr:methyltransferase domain-containing protein [Verrucomicrobiota bacterium]